VLDSPCSSKDRVTPSTTLLASQGQWGTPQSDRVAEGRPANTLASCNAIGSQSFVRHKYRELSIAYCDGTTIGAFVNPLSAELNPICYLLALLAHHFLHVSRIRVKSLTLRLLMSYTYGAPILDVSS
jgi:hypothetical protein